MKTITIITPANIELEYHLAGVGSRTAAFAIDLFIQILTISLFSGMMYAVNRQMGHLGTEIQYSTLAAIMIVFSFTVHIGYFIACEMLMNGRSIGKKIFGLRVIRDNGQPIEFAQALIRGVIRSTLDIMYMGMFAILFSQKHKRVGDMAAGTIVVLERYLPATNTEFFSLEPPKFLPPLEEMTPIQRGIVNEWLRRKDSLPDGGTKIGRQLQEYFHEYNLSQKEEQYELPTTTQESLDSPTGSTSNFDDSRDIQYQIQTPSNE